MGLKQPNRRDLDVSPSGTNNMNLVSTPSHRSPTKRLRRGISAQQKQALIDNLQLEITERARRLRAQYNLQAQGLRSRVEIRINRIPMSLRKIKMEELLLKCAERAQRPAASSIRPPVPAKDGPFRSPQRPAYASARAGHRPGRLQKGFSGEVNYDKENEVENKENPKKKPRGPHAGDGAPVQPKQVLSPASSNSRLNAGRPVSPTKSQIARPGSPLKGPSRTAAATTMLSNFVEKAKSSRAGGTKKTTTTSNTGINSTPVAPSARTRRGPAPKPPTSRPATRTGRRISANSETSEGSNATVIRKGAVSRTGAANTKKTMGTFTKGTASVDAKRTPAAKSAAASTTRTGRVLRNRG